MGAYGKGYIETTPTSDVMISYWNHFNRVSASDLQVIMILQTRF